MTKSTDELMKILKNAPDVEHYINENSEEMIDRELWQYISDLLEEKRLTIAKAARRGQMSDSYLYKIKQGRKVNISRDKMIQICFGLGLNSDESRNLMRIAGVGELYPRIRRDSIILYCLEKHIDIIECDSMLETAGDKTILNE
ncbi:MAG: helix-turn-helix domain-containing protein [Candidatus Ornithomonoglobus sp.]